MRLIKHIFEVDPLVCQHCSGTMRIIVFIEQAEIIDKILIHFELGGRAFPAYSSPTALRRNPIEAIAPFRLTSREGLPQTGRVMAGPCVSGATPRRFQYFSAVSDFHMFPISR